MQKIPEIKDYFDVEMAFARIEAMTDLVLDYIHNWDIKGTVTPEQKDAVGFTLMSIRDFAAMFGDQANKLQK